MQNPSSRYKQSLAKVDETLKLATAMNDAARNAIRQHSGLHGEALDAALSALRPESFMPLAQKVHQ